MTWENWLALAAVLLTAVGYLITQRTARRDRLAKSYAEALEAVAAYEELPYRIRRRAGMNYREELGRRISDVQESLFFHRAWIKLESEAAGDAYDALVRKAKQRGGRYRKQAWGEPMANDDASMHFEGEYTYENENEREACVRAMRNELNRWRWFR
jgi:hypothetical protein